MIAINLEPAQRQAVMPLLAAMRIAFVPAEADWDWAQQHFGVNGTPDCALIDQQGRVMFRPAVHDAASRAVLERQVEMLLDRPRQKQ